MILNGDLKVGLICIFLVCFVYLRFAFKKNDRRQGAIRYYPHKEGLIIVEDQGPFRKLYFDNLSCCIQSMIEIKERERVIFDYQKMLLVLLVHVPLNNRILIIGLGAGTLTRAIRSLFQNASIDHIEKHPLMMSIAQQEFHFQIDEKMDFYNQDALLCLKNHLIKKQQYHVVIVDAFNADGIPSSLLSSEFYNLLASVLAPQGVLLVNTAYQSRWKKEQIKLIKTYTSLNISMIPPMSELDYNALLLCSHQESFLEIRNLNLETVDLFKRFNIQYDLFFNHMQNRLYSYDNV